MEEVDAAAEHKRRNQAKRGRGIAQSYDVLNASCLPQMSRRAVSLSLGSVPSGIHAAEALPAHRHPLLKLVSLVFADATTSIVLQNLRNSQISRVVVSVSTQHTRVSMHTHDPRAPACNTRRKHDFAGPATVRSGGHVRVRGCASSFGVTAACLQSGAGTHAPAHARAC